jgi:hypothetical protein
VTPPETLPEERFAGHLGLQAPGCSSSMWFPISGKTASQLRRRMQSDEGGFALAETLSNRLLAFEPKQMRMISILDDADDWPDGDRRMKGPLHDYTGISPELYRLMAKWAEDQDEFEVAGSVAMRSEALSLIEAGGFLQRSAALEAYLRHTVIHFLDGTTMSYEARRENLLELLDIEGDPEASMVEISTSEGVERYFPLSKLRMIEIPLIELEVARLGLHGECE